MKKYSSTIFSRKNTIDSGAYGEVFLSDDNKATKIFKKSASYTSKHIKDVFDSEVAAYKIAMENEIIKPLVPNFYGTLIVDKVIDSAGNDITHEFEKNLAYQMEKIAGNFTKPCKLPDEIKSALRSAGINYFEDISAIKNGEVTEKIIDFATQYNEPIPKPIEEVVFINDEI